MSRCATATQALFHSQSMEQTLVSFLRTLGSLQIEGSTEFSLLGSNSRIFNTLNLSIDFSLGMKILDEVFFKNNDDWLKHQFVDGE